MDSHTGATWASRYNYASVEIKWHAVQSNAVKSAHVHTWPFIRFGVRRTLLNVFVMSAWKPPTNGPVRTTQHNTPRLFVAHQKFGIVALYNANILPPTRQRKPCEALTKTWPVHNKIMAPICPYREAWDTKSSMCALILYTTVMVVNTLYIYVDGLTQRGWETRRLINGVPNDFVSFDVRFLCINFMYQYFLDEA